MRGLRLAGHPLHPALVHFPLALWTVSLAADGAALATGAAFWVQAAWWCIVAGLAGAALAATAGFVDYSLLPPKHPAFRTATAHVTVMTCASLLFLLSALLRGEPDSVPGPGALACSILGLLAVIAGGWLGGTMIYRFGVAVEPVERLEPPGRDAPSA